jgi:hypothetical protein
MIFDISMVLVEIAGEWFDHHRADEKSDEINRRVRAAYTADHGHHPEGLLMLFCERCRDAGLIRRNHDRFHTSENLANAPADVRRDIDNFCPYCGPNEWPDWSPYLLKERPLPHFIDLSDK